jgi:hypothetical protein
MRGYPHVAKDFILPISWPMNLIVRYAQGLGQLLVCRVTGDVRPSSELRYGAVWRVAQITDLSSSRSLLPIERANFSHFTTQNNAEGAPGSGWEPGSWGCRSGRAHGLQKQQTAIAAEGKEVQMAPTVVALQTSRHGEPQKGTATSRPRFPPRTRGSLRLSLYSCET